MRPSLVAIASGLWAWGGLAVDAARAVALLREVEAARWDEGPAALVSRLRARGRKRRGRSEEARRRLSLVIYRLDRLLYREPNCYRRSLVRVALDRDAATEPFVLGLDISPGQPSGHAWVEGAVDAGGAVVDGRGRPYEVEFRL
jgi:hypothetical protein